jgi:pimeloyl-ACP methyl ester carboxylesterase
VSVSDGHYRYAGDDPAGVESAIGDLGRVGDTLGNLAGDVEHDTESIKQYWPQGHTGRVAAGDAARIGGALEECHQVFAHAERALGKLVPVLVAGRRKVDELNDAYRVLSGPVNTYEGLLVATHGDGRDQQRRQEGQGALRVARSRSGFESLADIDRAYAQVLSHVTQETTDCKELLDRLAQEASPPVGHAGGGSKYGVSFGLLAARISDDEVADILAGRTWFPSEPKAVHDAWLLLSADQHAALLKGDPGRFGNLNGIPALDRNTANRSTLQAQLDRLAVALKTLGVDPTTDPKDLEGRLTLDQGAYLETLSGLTFSEAKQALLLKIQLGRGGHFGAARLLAYEPGAYGGKGRAAVAYGDVDHADNIAVCVPGLNSSLRNVDEVSGDALALLEQARRADPGQTAVVAWQGYDAPDLANVAFQGSAEAGAKLLAADVNAMRPTHAGPIGTLTVVGHSYGSTTTGLALQREHLDVDQVVLIGSPGVGGTARTVAGLGLDKSRVFVGSASRDIVTSITNSLGEDPAEDTFGATRFKAESVQRSGHNSFSDHSLYYDSGNHSESLYSLASIVTGHGGRLGQDGMLAEPRHMGAGLVGMPGGEGVDLEASRTPTSGHDHANDPGRVKP